MQLLESTDFSRFAPTDSEHDVLPVLLCVEYAYQKLMPSMRINGTQQLMEMAVSELGTNFTVNITIFLIVVLQCCVHINVVHIIISMFVRFLMVFLDWRISTRTISQLLSMMIDFLGVTIFKLNLKNA